MATTGSAFSLRARVRTARARAFLDEVCGGDDLLHKQVEVLLAAHEDAGSLIERPAIRYSRRCMTNDRDELLVGQTITHYNIISLLGAGAMGKVYLAEDTRLGRKVALKLLPAEFTGDQERVRRFQQEAHAASALNHPNIITVHEIAHIDDRHIIVTEFIDGETLRERIRGDSSPSLSVAEVLKIGVQVADALAAAHEAGIVHRDIKPENIMVRRRDGYVKVLDFGLAKVSEVAAASVDTEAETRTLLNTSPGLVMGTVTYMSPEQVRAESLDARTDIWSLGVVLYELAAGCAPFERPIVNEIIALILERQPPPLSNVVPEIPAELERIISKALTKDKDQRYQTAKELLMDLRHLQHRLEALEEINESSSSEALQTEAAGLRHQPITHKIFKARYLRRAFVAHRRGSIIGAVALVLMFAAVVYRSYRPKPHTTIDSIAILPLVNAGNDPETEYLSDGISEDIINSLSQIQEVRVVPRATAFLYKDRNIDPRQVGSDLSVQVIMMGKLIQRGDALALQVELVETSKGSQIWGKHYEGTVLDVLAVKQMITRDITDKLRPELQSENEKRPKKGGTSNAEAYRLYLLGMHFWNRRTAADLKKAIDQFQQAIVQDPNYALPYVGLADSYVLLEAYAGSPASEVRPKARAAIELALQLDDSLAEAHVSLGLIQLFTWNFGEAEREYRRAIELNPNSATAYFFYGFYLHEVKGKFDEAMAEIRRAQRLDPLSPRISNEISMIHASKGELDAAQEAAKKVVELDPNFSGAHRVLGVVYLRRRRYDEAIAESKKAAELSGRGTWELAGLGVCYAKAGDSAAARAILKELEDKYRRGEALGQSIADVYAALGDKERAFAWLERDFQARSGTLPWMAYAPWSDTLRDTLSSDPRWQDLMRRMGLQKWG